MYREEIVGRLRELSRSYLSAQGFELVDFTYRRQGRQLVLSILADKPGGGITIDECSRLNSSFGRILDEKNILQEGYVLEVSSPGLDRPLINRNDFLRCINENVHFFLKEPVEGKIEIEGLAREVKEDMVEVDVGGKIIQIPLGKINKAKRVITKF